MPQPLDRLRATLLELEQELQGLDSLDSETRQVLEATINEIQTALAGREPQRLQAQPLIERLQSSERKFQLTHPTLASVVLRMIDVLGQAGI